MPEPTVTLVFRYDDYHASVGAEKDAIERRCFAAFAEAGIPLTVGVVPNFEERGLLGDDAAKLAALRELAGSGRVEAALHGLTHLPLTPPGVRPSEFAGQPLERQLARLRQGKALLEAWVGRPVVSFIPPWNTFDAATLDALGQLGFLAYSAALSELQAIEPVVSVPHTAGLGEVRRTVRWLAHRRPRTDEYGSMGVREYGSGRTSAPIGRPAEPTPSRSSTPTLPHSFVISMFHHFSFTDCTDALARQHARLSLAELPSLLAWCREQPGVEFLTVGEAAARHRALLADGRLEEARERWHRVYRGRGAPASRLARLLWRWSPRGLVRWAARRACPPRALLEPGGWQRGNRWLRRLGCGEPKPTDR